LYGGKYPFIQTGQIRESRKYINQYEQTYSEKGLKQSKLWAKGTLCITIAANIAELGILSFDACFPDSVLGFIPDKEKVELDFIYYTLTHFQRELKHIGEGSVQDNINLGTFQDLLFPIPPLPEQKAIAEILSSLDDKIDLLHRQNKTLEQMAETLFRQWFVEEAKEDWETGNILDYSEHSKISVHPKKNLQIKYYHYSIPSFDKGKSPVKEFGGNIQSNKYKVTKNCILFSKPNPHKDKRVWLLQNEVDENSICSTEFQIVKPIKNIFLFFIYGWLSYHKNFKNIASGVGGTSGSHQRIDPSTIFEYKCPIVEESYIEEYFGQVESIFKNQVNNQTQIHTLEKLRDTLLPKLMSGEVWVKM
jgi:type I restriction enzyme S subunit